MNTIWRLEHLFYEKRIKARTAWSREEKTRVDLINVYKYLKEKCKEDRARFFTVMPGPEAMNKN